MSSNNQSEIMDNPIQNTPEMRFNEETYFREGLPCHSKNRKSSTRDVHFRDLMLNSKEIDYIPEFGQTHGGRQTAQMFDQVLLSRISRRPSQDMENRTANQCYDLIAREYEFAFERIEVALQQKQIQVSKMKRQYQIQIQQKDQIIEELKTTYEDQLQMLDDNLLKLNEERQRLQQKTKEQQIQISVLKSENELIATNLKKTQKECSTKLSSAEKTIIQLQEAISDLNELIQDKNIKIKSIEKLSILSSPIQQPTIINSLPLKDDNHEQKLLNNYKSQIQQHVYTNKNLLTKILVLQNQINDLRQYKQSYFQNSSLLDNNLKITNSMIQQIEYLKDSLKLTMSKQSCMNETIKQQQINLSRLRFENQTLNNYNKVLLGNKESMVKENKFSMSRLRKQNPQILSTKFFS